MTSKINQLIKEFKTFSDWEMKYEKLILLGKNLKPMPESDKMDDLKIKGCQSQVWLKSTFSEDGKVYFSGDSDALIVRGLVALVIEVYSGLTPDEILKQDLSFLAEMGLEGGLSPSRSNGLYSMIKQIKYYATAYQYMQKIKS